MRTHPEYDSMVGDWQKWRLTAKGGRSFIEAYLEKYTDREALVDFEKRKKIAYCPAFAKAALNEIKNSIFQRMVDVSRTSGSISYADAIAGKNGGVDMQGNTMNSFIGQCVLPELLTQAKVGVFVDAPNSKVATKADLTNLTHPYLYLYKAEDILNWSYDTYGRLKSVLLKHVTEKIDADGLVEGTQEVERLIRKSATGVEVIDYTKEDGKDVAGETKTLDLDNIPFVIFELSDSLLADVADIQISLLNIASSDISYIMNGNFPFYTEQFDASSQNLELLRTETDAEKAGATGSNAEIQVGTTTGRRYPKGLERPGFINPSTEPINASMMKQDKLKEDIRAIMNLNLSNVKQKMASAESRAFDERGLEAGLSSIGLVLNSGEALIATLWAAYESKSPATVKYPETYSLKNSDERRAEAKELKDDLKQMPSQTARKEIVKKLAALAIGQSVSHEVLSKINTEIEQATVLSVDPEIIAQDIKDGLLSVETASLAKGYPEGEADKAKEEHAERLARVAAAQTSPEARGMSDLSTDSKGADTEKQQVEVKKEVKPEEVSNA